MRIIIIAALLFSVATGYAQERYVTIKGLAGANFQKWNSYDRDLFLTPGADVEIESYDYETTNSFYAQLGYHKRGSTLRGYGFNDYQSYEFNNIVLELGAKQGIPISSEKFSSYYLLAVRGEYTFSHNLDNPEELSIYSLVDKEFVKRFPFGVSVGVGGRLALSEGSGLVFEFTVNPDIGKQYDQPYELIYKDPITLQNRVLRTQEVRNISIELKVGYRFRV